MAIKVDPCGLHSSITMHVSGNLLDLVGLMSVGGPLGGSLYTWYDEMMLKDGQAGPRAWSTVGHDKGASYHLEMSWEMSYSKRQCLPGPVWTYETPSVKKRGIRKQLCD